MGAEEIQGGEITQSYTGPDIRPVRLREEKEAIDLDEFYERITSMVDSKIAEAMEEILATLWPDIQALLKNPNNYNLIVEDPGGGGGSGHTITTVQLYSVIEALDVIGAYTCRRAYFTSLGDNDYGVVATPSVIVNNYREVCWMAGTPPSPWYPELVPGDLIAVWTHTQDIYSRLVGLPVYGPTRWARTTEAATANYEITCNLYDVTGTEITSGEGSGIEVVANIVGGTALNAAIPRLADDTDMLVHNDRGVWYFVDTFQTLNTDQLGVTDGKLHTKLDEC